MNPLVELVLLFMFFIIFDHPLSESLFLAVAIFIMVSVAKGFIYYK